MVAHYRLLDSARSRIRTVVKDTTSIPALETFMARFSGT